MTTQGNYTVEQLKFRCYHSSSDFNEENDLATTILKKRKLMKISSKKQFS